MRSKERKKEGEMDEEGGGVKWEILLWTLDLHSFCLKIEDSPRSANGLQKLKGLARFSSPPSSKDKDMSDF
ncbi:hypothetical protein Q8A67_005974 [Cirrhinus molitorella]|uniref:Uncharacterized protein n=1 Tax=Cirrhinus molitorella TaxID=172907 RepID=A0AA88QBQ8_9TELE|nr:hypothetical protein Q8A67_005974 [Cirrhinus molitorella]